MTTCCLCDHVAIWRVENRGFCRDHKAEAYEAGRRDALNAHSTAQLRQLLGEPGHVWAWEKKHQ